MNDANFSACGSSSDILPYMYGEMSDAARYTFESHLLDCGACTDEFAEISAARFEVYEWKKLAFDPIVTPRFEIPYEDQAAAGSSWLDTVRTSFGWSWATPALAVGALVLVSFFATSVILSDKSKLGTALGDSNVQSDGTSVAVATPMPEIPEVTQIVTDPGEVRESSGPTRIQVSTSGRPEGSRDVRKTQRVVQPRPIEVKAQSARNTRSAPPTLNGFADDEDTSLRLAELLEDIETSE